MNIITVDTLSKKFCADFKRSMLYAVQDIGSGMFGLERNSTSLRSKEFWALDNISFDIKQGDSVGLIGSNGAGKSTLLRIISGLIKPDAGTVRIRGRVAPLIALGAGFNPILTGRENIFVNMSILGMTRREIKEVFDEVVEFAELGHALDTPVQSYSSGMAARLGFACAIFTHSDVLLIDEVLAVGDIKFRAKCYRKLAELKKEQRTFVLVSHSTQAILTMCDTAIYLSKGKLVAFGDSSKLSRQYENDLLKRENQTGQSSHFLALPEKPKEQSEGIDFRSVSFRDDAGNLIEKLDSGENAVLTIECYAHLPIDNVQLSVIIRELSYESITYLTFDSTKDNLKLDVQPGKFVIRIILRELTLKPGVYTAKFNINRGVIYMFDVIESFKFSVIDEKLALVNSSQYQAHKWEVYQQ